MPACTTRGFPVIRWIPSWLKVWFVTQWLLWVVRVKRGNRQVLCTVYSVLCQGYCQILVVGVLQRPTGKEGRLQQVCVFFFFSFSHMTLPKWTQKTCLLRWRWETAGPRLPRIHSKCGQLCLLTVNTLFRFNGKYFSPFQRRAFPPLPVVCFCQGHRQLPISGKQRAWKGRRGSAAGGRVPGGWRLLCTVLIRNWEKFHFPHISKARLDWIVAAVDWRQQSHCDLDW